MDSKIEDVLIRLKGKLNADQVKLWLPPFFDEASGSAELEIQNLASQYSQDLGITLEHCLAGIQELQNHALEKLAERSKFKETGLATLKVRVPGQTGGTSLSTVSIKLTACGAELKEEVAKQISNRASRLKLICQGKVLSDEKSLEEQNVKNGIQMMAVVLYDDVHGAQREESQQRLLETTREDLDLLVSNQDEPYLQLEDQSGNTLSLPPEERKSLLTAMTFQEKGKAALKNEDYSLALVMFLEADSMYNNCNSKILESVDNYALLNLDIAWCYLCLRSVAQIPDAETRLQKCENTFHKSYGPNLERLIALKGTSGNEACFFMRLHLLQSVVLFHKNRRQESKEMLARAERELSSLKVNDDSLCTLIELGYSPAEARLGLRATHGDVNAAADYITRNREERIQKRKEAYENAKLKKERKKLGLCADGKQYIDPNLLNTLTQMGFPKDLAKVALGQANNIVSNSVQLLQEQPELLRAGIPVRVSRSLTNQLVAMGFDRRMVKLALRRNGGNLEAAVEALSNGVEGGSNIPTDDDSDDSSTSSAEQSAARQEAFDRLKTGLSMVDDDHLDLTLVQEEAFLSQYKKLLD